MPTAEETTRAYIEKHFSHASKSEREKITNDWLSKDAHAQGIAADFERRVSPLAGLRILDAGSGNGGIALAFAKSGASVDGVEIEEDLIAVARAAAAAEHSSARFVWYEGTTLPFTDCTFDAAVSVSVIEHVSEPLRYFSEILRVLKPGGKLYLAFPNRLYPKETHTGLWGLSYLPLPLARRYVRTAGRNPLEEYNLHFYTYWDIKRLLQNSGTAERQWNILPEKGSAMGLAKRAVKSVLRLLGIPHQAFLPHVMLVLVAE
jgi:SAM-dependent methyltransferase